MDDLVPGKKHVSILTKGREPSMEPDWFNRFVTRIKTMPNNYSASLKVSLAPQHQGLYGQLIRDLYHDPNYSRNLAHNLPFSLESLGKVRIVLIFDSTWLPAAAREWLLMDVILFTMPLSTIQQMTQWVLAIYQNTAATPVPVRFKPPETIVLSNLFDHLASKGLFD